MLFRIVGLAFSVTWTPTPIPEPVAPKIVLLTIRPNGTAAIGISSGISSFSPLNRIPPSPPKAIRLFSMAIPGISRWVFTSRNRATEPGCGQVSRAPASNLMPNSAELNIVFAWMMV